MTLFILIPSPRFHGMSTVDSAWSLKEQPDAPTLAAERVSALVKAGQSARVETSEIRFLPPVVGCASKDRVPLEASGDALPECTPKAGDSADAVSSDWVRLLRIAHQAFASAFKGQHASAKDAAMELYLLLEAAESIYRSAPQDEPRHRVAAEIIGGAHIIAHHLNAIREMGKGLK